MGTYNFNKWKLLENVLMWLSYEYIGQMTNKPCLKALKFLS